jgi:hypothetical protein
MGVDFHIINKHEMPVQPPAFDTLVWDEQGELPDPWVRYFKATALESGDFHLNWGGMGRVCELLYVARVLVDVLQPEPFPEHFYADDDNRTLTDEAKALLSTGSGIEGTVPSFKFGSNDGWIVTPVECGIIARALRMRGPQPDTSYALPPGDIMVVSGQIMFTRTATATDWVQNFAEYCAFAAEHGGFEVW